MITQLSQSLIDEFNLVKIDREVDELVGERPEYGFRDFSPETGHLLWFYENGSF